MAKLDALSPVVGGMGIKLREPICYCVGFRAHVGCGISLKNFSTLVFDSVWPPSAKEDLSYMLYQATSEDGTCHPA